MIDRTKLYTHLVERFGWSVILLGWRSKVPTKGESPKLRAIEKRSLGEVTSWRGNLGIMGGEISGVAVVDLDSDRSVAWAKSNLPETPLVQSTHKGQHWFYRIPQGLEVRPKVKVQVPDVDGLELDIRGEESYVVGPWCVHPNGTLYEPAGDWLSVGLADVPELPEVLHPPAAPERPEKVLNLIVRRQPIGSDRQRLEARLMSYLDKCDPSVEGQGGQNTLFSTICRVLDLGWGDVSLISHCVAEWDAARSSPPWGPEYVEKMVGRCVQRFWSGACEPLEEMSPKPPAYMPSINKIEEFIRDHNPTRMDGRTTVHPGRPNRRGSAPDSSPPRDGHPTRVVSGLSRLLRQIPGANSARKLG